MTGFLHAGLAAGRWESFSLCQQLGNVGSEVGRALRWRGRDQASFDGAMVRALELMDLTLRDRRWRGRLKELARVREVLCDAWLGGAEYSSDLEGLDRYFLNFALVARSSTGGGRPRT